MNTKIIIASDRIERVPLHRQSRIAGSRGSDALAAHLADPEQPAADGSIQFSFDTTTIRAYRYYNSVFIFQEDISKEDLSALISKVNVDVCIVGEIPMTEDYGGVGGGPGNRHKKVDIEKLKGKITVNGTPAKILGAGANGIIVQHPEDSSLAIKILIDKGVINYGSEAANLKYISQQNMAPEVIGYKRGELYNLIVMKKCKGWTLQDIFSSDKWQRIPSYAQELLLKELNIFAKQLEAKSLFIYDFTPRNLMVEYDKEQKKWVIRLIDAGRVKTGKRSYMPDVAKWEAEVKRSSSAR